MASKRPCSQTASHPRKRARLRDLTNSSPGPSPAPRPRSYFSCEDQLVPEDDFCIENTDVGMYCPERFEFSPARKTKQLKRKRTTVRPSPSPGGFFISLPPEVLHKILALLEPQDIQTLCFTSRVLVPHVRGYVYTLAGLKHILPSSPVGASDTITKAKFLSLGKVMKGVSILNNLKARLKVASFFLDKLHPIHTAICGCHGSQTAYECLGLVLHTFISGWKGNEKAKAYDLIKSSGKVLERTKTVLEAVPGSLPWHEKDIRLLYRELFLSPVDSSDEEYGFWLSLILKPWPLVFQAKLLYLLAAPGDASGKVYWVETCGCSNLQHTSRERLDFSDLARSLRVLYHHKAWTEDDVITIFNELTTSTPNGWCLENVGLLLFGCGTAIVKGVLGSKAINGHFDELGMICYYMANCCFCGNVSDDAIDEDVSWFLHILAYVTQLLPTHEDGNKFIADLVSKWQTYILALFEDYDPSTATDAELEDVTHEFHSTVFSLSRLCQKLMQCKIHSLMTE